MLGRRDQFERVADWLPVLPLWYCHIKPLIFMQVSCWIAALVARCFGPT